MTGTGTAASAADEAAIFFAKNSAILHLINTARTEPMAAVAMLEARIHRFIGKTYSPAEIMGHTSYGTKEGVAAVHECIAFFRSVLGKGPGAEAACVRRCNGNPVPSIQEDALYVSPSAREVSQMSSMALNTDLL